MQSAARGLAVMKAVMMRLSASDGVAGSEQSTDPFTGRNSSHAANPDIYSADLAKAAGRRSCGFPNLPNSAVQT